MIPKVNQKMGRTILFAVLVIGLAMGGIRTGLAKEIAPAPPAKKVTKWKMNTAYVQAAGAPATYKFFVDMVKKHTGGQLDIEVVYGGALGYKGPEISRVLNQGLVEASEIGYTAFEGVIWPQVSSFFFIFKNSKQTTEFVERTRPMYETTYEKRGVKWLASYPFIYDAAAAYVLWSKKEVKRLDDFKGMKLRLYPREMDKYVLRPLGATSVFLPGGEVYMALKTGMIDGSFAQNLVNGIASRFVEVCPYAYLIYPSASPAVFGIGVSQSHFQKLPADVQKGLIAAGNEWQKMYLHDLMYNPKKYGLTTEKEYGEQCQKQGTVVKRLPDGVWQEIGRLCQDGLGKWAKESGPEAQQVANIIFDLIKKYPKIDATVWEHFKN